MPEAIAIVPQSEIAKLVKQNEEMQRKLDLLLDRFIPKRTTQTVGEIAQRSGWTRAHVRGLIRQLNIPYQLQGRDIVISWEDSLRIKNKKSSSWQT